MELKDIKKKIENILNRYYKETGNRIISPIRVFECLNQKLNRRYEIDIKEDE